MVMFVLNVTGGGGQARSRDVGQVHDGLGIPKRLERLAVIG
jgi:hypothetical protein